MSRSARSPTRWRPGNSSPAAEFELSSLLPANGGDGSLGLVLNGVEAGDRAGGSVSRAGDLNGDGIDDLVIGATEADPSGIHSGQVYVVFGPTDRFGPTLELSSLDGTNGFTINPVAAWDYLYEVACAGDVNSDGIDDLILGAPGAQGNSTRNRTTDPSAGAGEAYVIFGRRRLSPPRSISPRSTVPTAS